MSTQNIDRIFETGVRLDNFYANSSVSSPSRAALLTGRFPAMVGVPGGIRPSIDQNWGYFDPSAVTMPEVLKNGGYRTALIGKWHLGWKSPNLPNERGFEHFHGFLADMMDDYYTHQRQGGNYMYLNDKEITPKGHATELFTSWSVDYIKKEAKEKQLGEVPGEVFAAISMAMHEMQSDVHDVEDTVLTITRVKRSYSPWSSKIYTLRETPHRK